MRMSLEKKQDIEEVVTPQSHFNQWEKESGYHDIMAQRSKMQEVVEEGVSKGTLGMISGISLITWASAPVYDFKEIILDPFINISVSMLLLSAIDNNNNIMAKILRFTSKKFKQQCKEYHEALDTLKENLMHPENQKTIINYIVQLENEGRLPLMPKTSRYYHDVAAEYILNKEVEKLVIFLQQIKDISSIATVPTAYQKIVSQAHTKESKETRWWRKEI